MTDQQNNPLDDIDLQWVKQRVDITLRGDRTLSSLLSVRRMVEETQSEVLELVPSNHPIVGELRVLHGRLCSAIRRSNDLYAESILQNIENALSTATTYRSQRQPDFMRRELETVEHFMSFVSGAKQYMRNAVQRVRNNKPYDLVIGELAAQREQLFADYRQLRREVEAEKEAERAACLRRLAEEAARRQAQEAKERQIAEQGVPRATELLNHFRMRIQNRKVQEAEEALNQLRSEEMRLALVIVLGTSAKRDAFYSSAEAELKFIESMTEQRRMQHLRMRKIPVLR